MLAHKLRDRLPANLFLTLQNHAHIQRQLPGRGQQRLQRLHVDIHLPLVIHRPAGIEIAVALDRLKGRRQPFIKRIGRLNVVMAISQAGRLALGMKPVRVDQRMSPPSFNQLDMFHADPLQLGRKDLRRVAAIAFMLRQRGNGRDAQKRFKFVEEAGLDVYGNNREQ